LGVCEDWRFGVVLGGDATADDQCQGGHQPAATATGVAAVKQDAAGEVQQ